MEKDVESVLGQTRGVWAKPAARGAAVAVIVSGSLLLSGYLWAWLVATEWTGEVLFLLVLAGSLMPSPLLLVHLEHAVAVVVLAVRPAGLTQLGSLGGRSILPFLGLFLVGGWALQLVLRQRRFRPSLEFEYVIVHQAIWLGPPALQRVDGGYRRGICELSHPSLFAFAVPEIYGDSAINFQDHRTRGVIIPRGA